ncbi:Auxin-responsive protein [Quillaja saponaria]|uniref:Auxin-responsive protein n=1 Tax=Quillaja saponaria TaxID=32244 RepID=A0AAD7L4H9_QUISA|nr:Auxin-responsive protein [Quillaja saponaria]
MGVRTSKLRKRVGDGQGVYKRLKGPTSTTTLATPRGYVPICVGRNENTSKRFMVHTTALEDAEFSEMLFKSAEEYGFCNEGILRIPFEAKEFEEWMIRRRSKRMLLRVKTI